MMHPRGETREQREHMTRRALADAVRRRMRVNQQRQTDLARWGGVSRTLVQYVLRGNRGISLFLFLELSDGLRADPLELLRDVLSRRDVLRRVPLDE